MGRAYRYLLDVRLESGQLGTEKAREMLLAWWDEQPESSA